MNGSYSQNLQWMKALQQLMQDIREPKMGSSSSALSELDMVICPPFIYLTQVKTLIQSTFLGTEMSLKLGAQNVYCEHQGAYTGETSPNMLVDLECQYVIVGHSERRQWFGETDKLIARKFMAAYDAGLTPILCVGETLSERESGKTMERVESQVRSVLAIASPEVFQRALIAYEPVWAIGTGVSATPQEAQTVQVGIRSLLRQMSLQVSEHLRILYGGSVKEENAVALFRQPDIDGGLIGGASLSPQEFLLICQAAILTANAKSNI